MVKFSFFVFFNLKLICQNEEEVFLNENDGWVQICNENEIITRKRMEVKGRDISILKVKNDFFAIDSVCYHFGGPLIEGDIEEIGTHICLVCPWHRFTIDVKTGESLINIDGKSCISKGIQQRTHEVKVEKGKVYLRLSTVKEELASDHYAMMGLWKLPTSNKLVQKNSRQTDKE